MTRNRMLLLLLCQVLLAGALFAQSAQRVHVVEAGETLYRIGQNYGVTVAELYELNPTAREGIRPGQEIRIPAPQQSTATTTQEIYHAVQRGETLYSIARAYHTSVDAIMAANSQLSSPEQLATGMVLYIPVGSSSEAPVAQGQPLPPPRVAPTPQAPPLAPTDGIVGLRMVTVPAGATIYSLLRSTGWSEEEFYHYNPQAREGLKAGTIILIPDVTIENNMALSEQARSRTTIVLALPFNTERTNRRFSDYYSGVLLALMEAKQKGMNVDLHVVDCSDELLPATMSELEKLPSIDLIIGGVSETSVLELAKVGARTDATYVVPFTSREYPQLMQTKSKIYQVNTPHATLFRTAAEKFTQQYRGHHVIFLNHPSDSSDKEQFVTTLKQELTRAGIGFSDLASHSLSTPAQVREISMKYPRAVVVPSSGSKIVANNTLTPIAHAVDSLGVTNVTAFGYPEWQTYMGMIGREMRTTESTFYTTFYVDAADPAYKKFQSDFLYWFGRGVGSTYPKYSILGYDTAKYFLMDLSEAGGQESLGVQSSFLFRPSPTNPHYLTNLGVFFVRFRRGIERPEI